MAKQEKKKYAGEAYGIAGFVLGVASIVLSFSINGIITFILGTMSIVLSDSVSGAIILIFPIIIFGVIGLALSIKQQINKKTGLGLAGIILGIISIIIAIIILIAAVAFAPILKEQMTQQLQNAVTSGLGAGQLGNLG